MKISSLAICAFALACGPAFAKKHDEESLLRKGRGLKGKKSGKGGKKEDRDCKVADILLKGGTIVTMNGDKDIIEDGGIAIIGTKIDYVGSFDDVEAKYCKKARKKTIYVDDNDIILPGLVNGHNHSPMTLLRSIAGDDLPLQSWLNDFIFPAEGQTVTKEFVEVGAALAAMEMIATGTTTYTDMYYFENEHAAVIDKIGLRGILGSTVIGFPVPDAPTPEDALDLAREFIQNWIGHPRITPAVAPHAPYTLTGDILQRSAALAREFGVPISIHVSENQEEVDTVMAFSGGLTPFEFLDSIGFLGPDVIAAHSVVLSENDVQLILDSGTGVIHNPESNMKLASGVMPVRTLLDKGLKVGLGTDGPASNDNLDMFQAILITPLLQKVSNLEPTILSAQPVLEMATIRGASALGMDDMIGSLEAGKEADLIIVDGSAPHMVPRYELITLIVYSAKGSDVKTTMVAGELLYCNKEYLTLNPEAIIEAAREQAKIVREAVGI